MSRVRERWGSHADVDSGRPEVEPAGDHDGDRDEPVDASVIERARCDQALLSWVGRRA